MRHDANLVNEQVEGGWRVYSVGLVAPFRVVQKMDTQEFRVQQLHEGLWRSLAFATCQRDAVVCLHEMQQEFLQKVRRHAVA